VFASNDLVILFFSELFLNIFFFSSFVSEKIAKLREGLGNATNNVAEYRALLLGLKYALEKGYKNIQVQGDSNLVVKMVFYF
jgi:ribonuclease HI